MDMMFTFVIGLAMIGAIVAILIGIEQIAEASGNAAYIKTFDAILTGVLFLLMLPMIHGVGTMVIATVDIVFGR